jgi:vacuolar protein sorting-associated protein 54
VIYSPRNKSVDDELNTAEFATAKKKMSDAEVEGVRYKVVWSCLLLVEMVMTDMACAAHFKALAINMVAKVAELLRLFNSRSTQLVLGAGAIHSAARLKSINAKHLSLVTQCVGMIISILPHVRAALMAQLSPKQHTLLNDLDTIKREYEEHNEKILNKFVTIIGGIVEHGLAPRIGNTDFDERSRSESPNIPITCCIFLEGVSTNTRKMHQVLNSLLPPDHLQDSFSRIFAYLDQNLPELFIAANVGNPPTRPPTFAFPATDEGKKRMLLEVEMTTKSLNQLPGVRPWEFTAISVLEQELDYKLRPALVDEPPQGDPRDVQPTESTEDMTDSNAQSITKLSPSTDEGENDASLHADPSNAEKDSSSNADPSEPPTASNGNNDGSPEGEGTPENQNGTADHSDTEPPKGGNGSADMSPTELTAQVSPKEGTDALVEEHSNDNGSADKSPIEVTTDISPKVGMDAAEEKSYLSKNAHHHHEGMNGDGSL